MLPLFQLGLNTQAIFNLAVTWTAQNINWIASFKTDWFVEVNLCYKTTRAKKKERLSAFQHWWNWLALLYRQHLTWHSSTRIWAMKDVTPQFNGKSAFHNHIWISILHSYSKHNTLCSFPSLPTVSVQTTVFVFSRDEPCEYITVKRNN